MRGAPVVIFSILFSTLGAQAFAQNAPSSATLPLEIKGTFVGPDFDVYRPPTESRKMLRGEDFKLLVESPNDPKSLGRALTVAIEKSSRFGKRKSPYCQDLPKNTDRVWFGFEGFNSYHPHYAIFARLTRAIDVEAEILELYCKREKFKAEMSAVCEEAESYIHRRNFGFKASPALLKHLLIPYFNQAEFRHLAWRYYPEFGVESAVQCAKKLYRKNPALKIFVTGHSYGGNAALEFGYALADLEIPIEAMLTVDPVYRNLGIRAKVFEKPATVKTLYNFYQKKDTGSLWIAGIRGSSVKGADHELKLDRIITSGQRAIIRIFEHDVDLLNNPPKPDDAGNDQDEDPRDYSHIQIPKAREVQAVFLKLLRS